MLFAEVADLIVARDGSGDYSTIQQAIDAAPANVQDYYTILIEKGTYNEKIFIEKDFLALVGGDRDSTVIVISLLRDDWRSENPSDWGAATVNIADHVEDLVLAKLFQCA